MEAMAREWTDDRLDALNEKVDRGFEHVEQRFDQVDKRFERIEVGIDGLRRDMSVMQRQVTQGLIGLAVGMASGFVTLATLIVVASI
jgi:hypothetical protein